MGLSSAEIKEHYDPLGDRLWLSVPIEDIGTLHFGFNRDKTVERFYVQVGTEAAWFAKFKEGWKQV